MLERWYKLRRTLVDFRRGPLGPYFDGFAARLKERGYCVSAAIGHLSKCCLFNGFLMDSGITKCRQISQSLTEAFLTEYLAGIRTESLSYNPQYIARSAVKGMLTYLVDLGAVKPEKPEPVPTAYSWMLEPFLKYLRDELENVEATVRQSKAHLCTFFDELEKNPTREYMRNLQAKTIEAHVKRHLNDSPANLSRLASTLRQFLRFSARKGYTASDLSGVIPSIRTYRHATLPKGMEESDLQRVLHLIPQDTPSGSRDYAIMLVLMAYGVRGKSAAALLLDDIHWQQSTIRIRAQKGGKEVVLPLLTTVGEGILRYLRHRHEGPFREVFLTTKAPHVPLTSNRISGMVRRYMTEAGVKLPGGGSRTLRHSWAIRALAHDSPMKAIADVLGHRCLDTTFIYAKANLKTLRQVAMPWPGRG